MRSLVGGRLFNIDHLDCATYFLRHPSVRSSQHALSAGAAPATNANGIRTEPGEAATSTIQHIVAQNVDALRIELARLPSGETAYVTADDYKRITEEDLDEFSTVGRKMIAEIAAGAKCAIRIEGGRILFTKK
jgi:hypothetical protein